MSKSQKFRSVQEVLSDPDRWTKGESARDADGNPIALSDPEAVCWCLCGAMDLVYDSVEYREALDKLLRLLPIRTRITEWNDDPDRTHQEVLDLVTKAGV